jgi:hypothetical protein
MHWQGVRRTVNTGSRPGDQPDRLAEEMARELVASSVEGVIFTAT